MTNRKIANEPRKIDPDLQPGDYVQVLIADNGAGIPPDLIDKVFDPFFTTKPVGQGTGFGLSMVYGFAKQSGGHVSITSELGVGTSVCLLLPLAVRREVDLPSAMPGNALPKGTETILLVEDNDLVRAHVHKQLRLLGYTVLTSSDGRTAIEQCKTPQAIDRLFSDIVMPGDMDGMMLAEAARKLRPDLKILLTSGYSESTLSHQGNGESFVNLLPKPYSRAKLAKTLRFLLNPSSSGEGY